MQIGIIDDNKLKRYNIIINEDMSENIKELLKNVIPPFWVNVKCLSNKKIVNTVLNDYDYDEVIETDYVDASFHGYDQVQVISANALVKKYSVLYNCLFGKYKEYNENFIHMLYLYLNDLKGIKGKNGFDIEKEHYGAKKLYDEEIEVDKRVKLVELLMSVTSFELVSSIALDEVDAYIDSIDQPLLLNSSSLKKMTELKETIELEINEARQNAEELNSIRKLLGNVEVSVHIN